MKYISLDTETDSKYPNTAGLLSFGALVTHNLQTPLEVYERFYAVEKEVPVAAANINKLSKLKLQILSNGKDFVQQSQELVDFLDDSSATIIGYNVKSYDMTVLKYNLANAGISWAPVCEIIDLLPIARRVFQELPSKQLGRVYGHVCVTQGFSRDDFDMLFKQWCDSVGGNYVAQAHSAVYDSYMVTVIAEYLNRQGLLHGPT